MRFTSILKKSEVSTLMVLTPCVGVVTCVQTLRSFHAVAVRESKSLLSCVTGTPPFML